jgi:hypothetical protein
MLPAVLSASQCSSGRDETERRLPCQYHGLNNLSVPWRNVIVPHQYHVNASTFMDAIASAYLE